MHMLVLASYVHMPLEGEIQMGRTDVSLWTYIRAMFSSGVEEKNLELDAWKTENKASVFTD